MSVVLLPPPLPANIYRTKEISVLFAVHEAAEKRYGANVVLF